MVVTGIGLVTPLAVTREESWRRLLVGDRAARYLLAEDVDYFEQLTSLRDLRRMGAPVDHAEVRRRLKDSGLLLDVDSRVRQAWIQEPVIAMTLLALQEAADDSGISLSDPGSQRRGCFVGASKGGLRTAETLVAGHDDPDGILWNHAFQVDGAARAVAAAARTFEAMSCPVAACATGLISILQAASAIFSGQCDVCFAGSADAALRASVLSSFHRLRVTSRKQPPEDACSPFDQSRDGFVVGEGAAVLILESRQHAVSRGCRPYARVTAGGWLNDPTGMTQIDSDGTIVEEVLRRTMNSVTVPGGGGHFRDSHKDRIDANIDYISLHGTGTESNDLAEANGLMRTFGSRIPFCSAQKGATGHLLGAAGSTEAACTILALRDQIVPLTSNLICQDARFHLPLVTSQSQQAVLHRALKLSLGFGGHVACAIFDREPQET